MKSRPFKALLLTMAAASLTNAQAADWSYTGEHGVDHWGKHFTTCGEGANQTPIDIKRTIKAELAPLHIDYQGKVREVINNGHTVQANVEGKNQLIIDGQTFDLQQFHFHTPSENFIAGKQFPLEVHFVHANAEGQLAVVAAMFKTGPRGNEAFDGLLATVPEKNQTVPLDNALNPADLLPREREYYRFSGSLTTPPCSEGVRWFVMREAQTGTEQQIDSLHQVMGDNARPLQPLNARVVLE
ncbi:carbonic anhydrase family protein [Photobacterium sp. DA100]|uniref:carbonic anhydrase n=1 Tax=Photobacterium sp. DA100 TaxID=3027472 RepID=UPI00247A9733|nr:carbonic anhydrase family protein [Photobacterium sp. DA100]WEM42102.1 carbonic anhydrase family protein [Photobacterium sp. DA100]